MKIQRKGKDFIVIDGIVEVAQFDNFEVARTFLAENSGNVDAAKPLNYNNTRRGAQIFMEESKVLVSNWRNF